MSLRLSSTLLAFTLLAGCATTPRPVAVASPAAPATPVAAAQAGANDNLNAVAWSQDAIEHDLIFVQTYRDAQSRLLAALHDSRWDALGRNDRTTPLHGLKPAVILDIDETVLDNSPFAARMVQGNREYNEAEWAAWCREGIARALPGAVEFTRFAASHGIAVIYISNRAKDLDQATLANLRKAGLPVAGPQSFLGLGIVVDGCEQAGTEKGCRRQLVAQHYRVLMQFGDQIGDFVDVSLNTLDGRRRAVADYLPWIGTRWFVLPNPTYGSWEPALFDNDWSAAPELRRQKKIEALHTN
ncbi:5'-nucleotidase, lipoprotein e(P4) family [Rhodanobacter ginsengiterrae]|uniref:5'-nucleotidase, lipoprotein e(P4) family n=1 Tax=Rhodanobacter ginsengiterrae TaxID=2008451 RepID=UPI003CF673DC